MTGDSMAWWWTEILKAITGPGGVAVVSLYVIKRLFESIKEKDDQIKTYADQQSELVGKLTMARMSGPDLVSAAMLKEPSVKP